METTNEAKAETVHKFERAGLGKAPFRFVGVTDADSYGSSSVSGMSVVGTIGGCEVSTRIGGTCDYCGKAITDIYRIESSDGKRFNVGCDCADKCGDRGIIVSVGAAANKIRTERAHARADAKIAAAVALLPVAAEALRTMPHPSAWAAKKGLTRLDWATWMLQNAGRAGKVSAATVIGRAAKMAA
jgi:hypothetical protein